MEPDEQQPGAYVPPRFYRRLHEPNNRWKVSAKLMDSSGLLVKIKRSMILPDCLGLGKNGRWQWEWIPLSLLTGVKSEPTNHGHGLHLYRNLQPYIRVQCLSPVPGKLALWPELELSLEPAVTIMREFSLGNTKLMFEANFKACKHVKDRNGWPCCTIKLDWIPDKLTKVQSKLASGAVAAEYSRRFSITQNNEVVLSAVANNKITTGIFTNWLKCFTVKISQTFGCRATRKTPPSTAAYLKATKDMGKLYLISIAPGHWIDPGSETGAPGERDFNLEVADVLEKQLDANGWNVLRPDRDAHLSWEEYLNWVSRQTHKGVPVLEIHGQGYYKGFSLGVIGDIESPLTKELAREFGYYKMNWRKLGVPQRGGVILETFNADEVLQMAPWHRLWAVKHIASRVARSIEHASYEGHALHGIHVDTGARDNDLFKQCGVFNQ